MIFTPLSQFVAVWLIRKCIPYSTLCGDCTEHPYSDHNIFRPSEELTTYGAGAGKVDRRLVLDSERTPEGASL